MLTIDKVMRARVEEAVRQLQNRGDMYGRRSGGMSYINEDQHLDYRAAGVLKELLVVLEEAGREVRGLEGEVSELRLVLSAAEVEREEGMSHD